jgi:tetratricopeptide (TPR) repeat protein
MLRFSVEDLLTASDSLPANSGQAIKTLLEQWTSDDAAGFSQTSRIIINENMFANLAAGQLPIIDFILDKLLLVNQMRGSIGLHADLVDLTASFLQACNEKIQPPSFSFMNHFFRGANRLLASGETVDDRIALQTHAAGQKHHQLLKVFVELPVFKQFIDKGPDTPRVNGPSDPDLQTSFNGIEHLELCHQDLLGLLHTRRYDFFKLRLELVLGLVHQIPTLQLKAIWLPEIITWARHLFDFDVNHLQGLKNCLDSFLQTFPGTFSNGLIDAWQMGERGRIPGKKSEEPALTTEFVYREALKEIFGDGVLSPREEEYLKNLRDYLEIPQEKYQQIFAEVSALPRSTNLEFEPYEFFFNLTTRAMQDGVLEDSEKALLAKAANALELEKEAVHQIFAESVRNAPKPVSEESFKETPRDRLTSSWFEAIELRRKISKFSIAEQIKALGEQMVNLSTRGNNEEADEREQAKLVFIYEPEIYAKPLFLMLTTDQNRESLRLRLRGEDLKLRGSVTFGQDMTIINRSQDREAPINFSEQFNPTQMKAAIKTALDAANGCYVLALVPYPSLNPIFIKTIHGSIELSGALERAEKMLAQNNFQEAINIMQQSTSASPEIAEGWFTLGNSYRAMARQHPGVEADKMLDSALNCYAKICETWPKMAEGWAGTAMILRQRGKLEESISNMEKAIALQPMSISNRLTYAFYGLLKHQNDPKNLFKFLKENLSDIYNFMPNNQRIIEFIGQVNEKFGIEIQAVLQMTEIDASFQ